MSAKAPSPKFSQSQVVEMLKRLYQLTPSEIRLLPSYSDQNFYVMSSEDDEYILKIMNPEESADTKMMDVQTCAMSFLQQKGLPTQKPLPTISGELMSLEEADCGHGCQKYLVRLLTYLQGTTISKVPLTPQILYDTGKIAARMDIMLQDFEHPYLNVLQRETYLWSLGNIPLLEEHTYVLDGHPLQELVKAAICQYKSYVVPKLSDFRKSINHGDLTHLNMLVHPHERNGHRISGILDFADLSSGYFVFELAVTIMHMMTEHPNPIEVGGSVLAGWESVLSLNEAEKDCLYVLVLSRISQMLVLINHAVNRNPENKEYLTLTTKNGFHNLRQLCELGKEHVEKVWFQTAAQFSEKKE